MYRDNCCNINGLKGKKLGDVQVLKELYLKRHGTLGDEDQLEEYKKVLLCDGAAPCISDESGLYEMLLNSSAGESTTLERAVMCGLTTLELHGEELAGFMLASWLT
jgi:hypothetical protein